VKQGTHGLGNKGNTITWGEILFPSFLNAGTVAEQVNSETSSSTQSKEASNAASWKRIFSLGSILPVIALVLSIASFFISEGARRDVARVDVIKTDWGQFREMAALRIQYPMMAHLFEGSGELYDRISETIRLATESSSPREQAVLSLQERAVAGAIFTFFEQTYYLWREAQIGEKNRAALIQVDLNYFSDLLCNNPRLLWYWDEKDGGKLGQEFGDSVRAYYGENILKDCAGEKDARGPFYGSSKVDRR